MARASGTTPSVGFKRPLEGGITRSGRSTTSRYAGSPSEQQQEQQACTLDIGDHARARKTDVSLTFENLMCFCCNDYTGGNMMRQECSRPDCNVWSFFCSRHVFRPDFPVTVCMTCKSPGARVLLANTVTSIMKNCILLPCQKSEAGCQELETTDKMEAHLQHACMYNYVPCPKPGCLKSYVVKDKEMHVRHCEYSTCRYRLIGPGHNSFGCDWEGNKRDKEQHECAVPNLEVYEKLNKAVAIIRSEHNRCNELEAQLGKLNDELIRLGPPLVIETVPTILDDAV